MKALFRVLVTSVVVVATFFSVEFLSFFIGMLMLTSQPGQRSIWILHVIPYLCAVGAGWYAWRGTRLLAGNVGDAAASGPAASIAFWAFIIGLVSFTAGVFGGLSFFPPSNLGPIPALYLGIFVTGPVGALAGALLGIVRLAKNANAPETRAILAWLSAVWVLTLLYTLFMMRFVSHGAFGPLPAIGVQALIVISSAFLLFRGNTRTRLSERVCRCRLVAIATLALIMLMTVFPPVTRPWWGPKAAQESTDSGVPLPRFAFILDGRFDSSRHVPLLVVDRRVLVLEWVMSAMAALAVSQVMIRRRGPNQT